MKLSNIIPRWLNRMIPYRGSIRVRPSMRFLSYQREIYWLISASLDRALEFAEKGESFEARRSLGDACMYINGLKKSIAEKTGKELTIIPIHYDRLVDAQGQLYCSTRDKITQILPQATEGLLRTRWELELA